MGSLALALLILYVAFAFGARTVIHLRRTGNSGFRGLSGRPGSVESFAGVLFVVASATELLGPVAGIFGLSGIPGTDPAWLHWGGAAIAVVGTIATLLAQVAMGESWRIGVYVEERTELVTSGPFRLVRNPIFTAMLVTTAGIALMVPNLVAVLGWVGLFIAIELQVRCVEEPYLIAQHGKTYRHYAESTGRFLPGLGEQRSSR